MITIDVSLKSVRWSVDRCLPCVGQEKAKVRDCAKKAERWLFQKLDQQANVPPSKNPVSRSSDEGGREEREREREREKEREKEIRGGEGERGREITEIREIFKGN